MNENLTVLWDFPSTMAITEKRFLELPRRRCLLSLTFEQDDGTLRAIQLVFEDVEAFKCTHRFACTQEMIESAYERVVDLGETDSLLKVKEPIIQFGLEALGKYKKNPATLRHVRVCFDGGPCYEFVCQSFSIEENSSGAYDSSF